MSTAESRFTIHSFLDSCDGQGRGTGRRHSRMVYHVKEAGEYVAVNLTKRQAEKFVEKQSKACTALARISADEALQIGFN